MTTSGALPRPPGLDTGLEARNPMHRRHFLRMHLLTVPSAVKRGALVAAVVATGALPAAAIVPAATPALADSESITFSDLSNGTAVPYITANDGLTVVGWGSGWTARSDARGTAAVPNESGSHSASYAMFEHPSNNADETSSDGWQITSLTVQNLDTSSNTFTFYCGDTSYSNSVAAQSTATFSGGTMELGGLSSTCNASARPMGDFGIKETSGALNTLGIQSISISNTDSNLAIGAAYWNAPATVTDPNTVAIYTPYFAHSNSTVNTFWTFIKNSQVGSDTKATYEFALYDNISGLPGDMLTYAFCDFNYDTSGAWQGCGPVDSPAQEVTLTQGNEYYIGVKIVDSHAQQYNLLSPSEDWGWAGTTSGAFVNTVQSTTAGTYLPSPANGDVDTSYPDLGRHAEMYMNFTTPTTLIGDDNAQSPVTARALSGSTTHEGKAEQFTAQATATGTVIHAYINTSSSGAVGLWVHSDNSGELNVGGASQSYGLGSCDTTGTTTLGWRSCTLDHSVSFVRGTKYWLEVNENGSITANSQCGNYDGGSGCANDFGLQGTSTCDGAANTLCSQAAWNNHDSTTGNLLIYVTAT